MTDDVCKNRKISTHDLTKRSTSCQWQHLQRRHISTHDLTKRSTTSSSFDELFFNAFQLTTSRRGRHNVANLNRCRCVISTHDLTKRSTVPLYPYKPDTGISTHDLTKRSTFLWWYARQCVCKFQLTTSRRGRRSFVVLPFAMLLTFQLTTSRRGRRQFLRKKFSFPNYFLCLLHIIYSYYINTIFFSTLFFAKSSFFLVRIP